MAYIDKILEKNNDSLTLNCYQVLSFLKRLRSNSFGEKGRIKIDDCIDELKLKNGNRAITYNEVYKLLPPSFFKCDLYIKHKDEQISFDVAWLSSGEKQMLYSISAVLYQINNLAKANADTRIIPYKHINIVFDEVELYCHPEFQRSYIYQIVSLLRNMHIDTNTIRSINLIIATHSPFIVSDVPKENILVLEDGKRRKMDEQTYCANIYDLMKNSFFLEFPMGEAARRRLDDVVQAYNKANEKRDDIHNNSDFYSYLKDIIADSYLKNSISLMIDSILDENKQGLSKLLARKKDIERQLEELNTKIDILNEEN